MCWLFVRNLFIFFTSLFFKRLLLQKSGTEVLLIVCQATTKLVLDSYKRTTPKHRLCQLMTYTFSSIFILFLDDLITDFNIQSLINYWILFLVLILMFLNGLFWIKLVQLSNYYSNIIQIQR